MLSPLTFQSYLGQIEELQETSRRMEKVDTLGYLKDVETQQSLSIAEQLRRQEEEDEEEVKKLAGASFEIIGGVIIQNWN